MRRVFLINNDWKFSYGECTDVESDCDFSKFYDVGLPHTFTLPYLGKADFYVGYGVYTKQLDFGKTDLKKRILIEFGAVFQVAEVYLNGQFIVKHEGGYTAFYADLTDKICEGQNTLVVRVNNMWSPTIAPRAGEHTFCGGIYRDVKIIVSDRSCIDWYGIFVKTIKVKENFAEICAEVETRESFGKTLRIVVVDEEMNVVVKENLVIDNEIVSIIMSVPSPKLWSIETPHMYTLVASLDNDECQADFGIRTILWDAKRGFFLNGKRVLLQGANVHQDHGGWGDAVTHSGIARDVLMMKGCGMNFIRGSHYPHHTVFADECDKQGMLFWSEGVFWGIGGFVDEGYWDCSAMPTKQEDFQEFERSLTNTLKEMIRTNRNHPSIIAWSMGNEIFFSKKEVIDDAKALVGRLVQLSRVLDTTRPAAIGGVQRAGFDQIGDIAGYNGDGAVLFHAPKLPSIVAEYGSIASYRPGKFSLNLTKGSDDFYDWRAGRAIWCGFHHGSIANIGDLGIVDLYRLPLRSWYAYRQKYLGVAPPPDAKVGIAHALKIDIDKKTIKTDGTDDCMLVVQVVDKNGLRLANDAKVLIEVLSGAAILPTGRKMLFSRENKNFYDGACAIEIRSYFSGKSVVVSSAEGLVSAQVEIDAVGATPFDGRQIVLPQEPCFEARKVGKGVNIVAHRPIVVSSESIKGTSCNISDGNKNTVWTQNLNDLKPTVVIDLENKYDRFCLMINLAKNFGGVIVISGSTEGDRWQAISQVKTKKLAKNYRTDIMSEDFRYIKIEFCNCKRAVSLRGISAILQ